MIRGETPYLVVVDDPGTTARQIITLAEVQPLHVLVSESLDIGEIVRALEREPVAADPLHHRLNQPPRSPRPRR